MCLSIMRISDIDYSKTRLLESNRSRKAFSLTTFNDVRLFKVGSRQKNKS